MPMIDADTAQRLRLQLLHDAGAAEKCGFANVAVSPHDLRALLNTIAELRRAEAEAYERAAQVCESVRCGSAFAVMARNDCIAAIRAITKQQDTDPKPTGQGD